MNTIYQNVNFTLSVNQLDKLPDNSCGEVAFVGRSNAGKSSALNALTMQKTLARVSKTPGRTQLINYFQLPNSNYYLVDLPGYGYANVPNNIQQHWQYLLGEYLMNREQLLGIILIMDIRHPCREGDLKLLDCCHYRQLPVHILLTKADKLKYNQQCKQIKAVTNNIKNFSNLISIQLFSALKNQGRAQLINNLDKWFFNSSN